MTRIYISHFPFDTSRNEVQIIRDRLSTTFGADSVLDSTGEGMNTTTDRQQAVKSCDVLLVVIGKYWANMVDEDGNRLIDDVYDAVHVEIDAGLKSFMEICVLVVDGIAMPPMSQIPDVLRSILKKDIFELSDHEQLEQELIQLSLLWSKIPKIFETDKPIIEQNIVEETDLENNKLIPRIYISHFPNDSSHHSLVFIRDHLNSVFGIENILDSSGKDMNTTTERAQTVQSCDILLVVVGEHWVNTLLEDSHDLIHAELHAGLRSPMKIEILVVGGVSVPVASELPHALQPLLEKNVIQIRGLTQLKQVLDERNPVWLESPIIRIENEDDTEQKPSDEIDFPHDKSVPRIYISYFPEDTSRNEAQFIRDHLSKAFGVHNVLDSTERLMDTMDEREHMVQSCDVLLVVIGQHWVKILSENTHDLVYAEFRAGYKSSMDIFVLIVDDAEIPIASELPHVAQPLLNKTLIEVAGFGQLERFLNKEILLWSKIPANRIEDKPKKFMPQESRDTVLHSFRPQGLTPTRIHQNDAPSSHELDNLDDR